MQSSLQPQHAQLSCRNIWLVFVGALATALGAASVSELPAAERESASPPAFKHLKYRLIGPAAGGRVCRVAGVAGDPLVYYTATAAGGVWKSSDAGITWKPMTDSQPVLPSARWRSLRPIRM